MHRAITCAGGDHGVMLGRRHGHHLPPAQACGDEARQDLGGLAAVHIEVRVAQPSAWGATVKI